MESREIALVALFFLGAACTIMGYAEGKNSGYEKAKRICREQCPYKDGDNNG